MQNSNTPKLTKQFYVYVFSRPNGDAFYVGKGSGRRVLSHLSEARTCKCKCRKCEIIQEIWVSGREPDIQIVFESDNVRDVLEHERQLIEKYCERVELLSLIHI